MILTPRQQRAIAEIFSTPTVDVATVLGLSREDAEALLVRATAFIVEVCRREEVCFTLEIEKGARGLKELKAKTVRDAVKASCPLITIDERFRFVRWRSGKATVAEASARTRLRAGACFVVMAGAFLLIVNGTAVVADDLRRPSTSSALPRRRCENLPEAVDDHKRHYLDRERGIRYWAQARERILKAPAEGTEKIFQHALFWWLDNTLLDRVRVFADPRGFGQDATDVTVISTDGRSRVIEVKWLGRNEAGTAYANPPRVNEGLIQVGKYLDHDASLAEGFLVVYDARADGADMSFDGSVRHLMCSEPIVVFLDSEDPSRAAVKEAQDLKRRLRTRRHKPGSKAPRPRRHRDEDLASKKSRRGK